MTSHPLADRHTVFFLLFQLAVLAVSRRRAGGGVAALRAVAPPVSTAGVLGRQAEFACSVADKAAGEVLMWRLEWDALKVPQYVHLETERNETTFIYDGFFAEKHATYSTRYIVNGSVHTSVLHLDNIQAADEGSVVCMYQLTLGGSLVTRMIPDCHPVRFTVWKLPVPSCSFTVASHGANATSLVPGDEGQKVGATVELTCTDSVGIPTPELTWSAGRNLSSARSGTVVHRHDLRAADNGRWFTCEARSEATTAAANPVYCSVRPMAVPPTAAVRPTQIQLIEGAGNIEFTCTGRGLPEIVSYQWFIDGLPTYQIDHQTFPNIKITHDAPRGSVLTLESIFKLGRTEVGCEVAVGAGFTGRASGEVLIFRREDVTAATKAPARRQHRFRSEPFQLSLAPSAFTIILAVAFLLVVVAVVLFLWHRRRGYLTKQTRFRYAPVLSPTEPPNGAPARHTKRFWAYMVTAV